MQQRLSIVPMPQALSQSERSLVTHYVRQVADTAHDMRSLSHKLAVDVSRAAEFAHAHSRSLEGAALLEMEGLAQGFANATLAFVPASSAPRNFSRIV